MSLSAAARPLLTAALLVAPVHAQDAAPFPFEEGDRICLIGNALAERMQHYGHLEARLQTLLPEKRLSFLAKSTLFGNPGIAMHDQAWKSLFEIIIESFGDCPELLLNSFGQLMVMMTLVPDQPQTIPDTSTIIFTKLFHFLE